MYFYLFHQIKKKRIMCEKSSKIKVYKFYFYDSRVLYEVRQTTGSNRSYLQLKYNVNLVASGNGHV